MRDIRYKWNEGPNSVGVSNEVSLPQFKVLGYRQRAMEISLTTGTCRRLPNLIIILLNLLCFCSSPLLNFIYLNLLYDFVISFLKTKNKNNEFLICSFICLLNSLNIIKKKSPNWESLKNTLQGELSLLCLSTEAIQLVYHILFLSSLRYRSR